MCGKFVKAKLFIFNFWCTPPCFAGYLRTFLFLVFVRNWGQAHVKKVHPFSVGGVHFWLWFALLVTWNSRFLWAMPFEVQTLMRPNGSQSSQHNITYYFIYLWRKVVCFVFVVMRCTKPGCFRLSSWCLWKALDKEGCMGFRLSS